LVARYFRTGLYKAPMPLVTGQEGAGIVVAVHPSVTDIKEGDRVGYMGRCSSYSELSVVLRAKLVKLPDGITTLQAAASLIQGCTALTLIREAAMIQPGLSVHDGPWVLVHAAAGGTGSQMVQMLYALGAKVIGTASTKEKCELVRKSGAQWVINSKEEDLVARVKEITMGKGPDVIFDGVGKATFEMDLEMIARKGSLITFGNAVSIHPATPTKFVVNFHKRLLIRCLFTVGSCPSGRCPSSRCQEHPSHASGSVSIRDHAGGDGTLY
jgi:NADPH2:quinone reductase